MTPDGIMTADARYLCGSRASCLICSQWALDRIPETSLPGTRPITFCTNGTAAMLDLRSRTPILRSA